MKTPIRGFVKVWQGGKLVAAGKNMVVSDGLLLLAQRIVGENVALPTKFKLGTSAALTTSEMTNLQGSLIATFTATLTRRTTVLSWSGEYTHDDITEQNCREIGLFQAGDSGRMLARFLPVQQFLIKSGTPIKVNWEIIIGDE